MNHSYLNTSQAAKYLGVSKASIRRWADDGKLKCGRTPGGQRRFFTGELDRFARAMSGQKEES